MNSKAKKPIDKAPLTSELKDKYFDNSDLKQILKVCDKTLYRYRKLNLLKYCLLGGKFYYPKKYFKNSMKITEQT